MSTPTSSIDHTTDYLRFLGDCPSPFHAAHNVAQRLEDLGFRRQVETDPWEATPGGHVLVREGAVVAWVIPHEVGEGAGFRVVGAHTDSPTFTLKPMPSTRTADGWGQLEVEVYGGMLWNSWLDRELALAGRLVTTDGQVHLVRTGALARIPQLAIHLDRGVNGDGLKLDPQKHLHPVFTVGTDADVLQILARDAGLAGPEQIASFDVVTIPAQGAAVFGAEQEFVASGRQDNLSSVHAGVRALELAGADWQDGAPAGGDVWVFACFDHEEVGSDTRTGAAGPLLQDVLTRTAAALGRDLDGTARMVAASSCVSADAAHSVHPNYVERHDPAHHPVMGGGPVLKVNANQRYATDAVGVALWKRVCAAAGVPVQAFVSNNAMPCGSTIGPITATRLGMTTVDVGVPLLSMHSAREMSHVRDLVQLSAALGAYWQGA
ncbi:M18 family aminopeptidase [Schaalia sp. 19OD2882]|uniref:M18 family aminopeptidase n=1 Tax=Schaalia sp. 19OD2882 TaxID=2794089 RepID=UPI001C1EBD0A|nr:M18 family aminopeptidase [Schaalia sp. 19OD2882]QWW19347.1 M18 family aminopeptidase [Schaalia sp. 19OD2882]